MIKRLKVKNFKALRDVEVSLTPIHVLIGPNDSGKTSILDALAAICRSVDHNLADAFLGSWKGSELVWSGRFGLPVTIEVDFDRGTVSWLRIQGPVCRAFPQGSALVDEEVIAKGKGILSDLGTLVRTRVAPGLSAVRGFKLENPVAASLAA